MPFIPDDEFTPDSGGFVPDAPYDPRNDPSNQAMIQKGKAAESFLNKGFFGRIASSLNPFDKNVNQFMTPGERLKTAGSSLAKVAYEAPARLGLSTYEVATHPSLGRETGDRPQYNLPGVGKVQSFQSDAQQALEEGAKPFSWPSLGKPALDTGLAGLQAMGTAKMLFGDIAITPRGKWEVSVPEWVAKGGKIQFSPGYEAGQFRPGLIPKTIQKGVEMGKEGLTAAQKKMGEVSSDWNQKDWRNVMTKNKSTAKLLSQAETQGKDPTKVLKDVEIVTDKGKIYTQDTIQQLQDRVRPYNETLSGILKKEGTSVPVDEFERRVLRAVDNSLTQGQNVNLKMADDVAKEFSGIRANYGDQIPLDELNNIKIGQRIQSGIFDQTKPKFSSDVNYQISNVARKLIEENVKGVPVKELNNEIGNFYEAMDILKKLDGQVLKGGALSRLIGTGIGSTFGHTPVGKISGAVSGNYVVSVMQDMSVSNPVKMMMLKYAQENEPQVYQEAMKYLTQLGQEQATRPLLGSGNTIFLDKNTPSAGQMNGGRGLEGKVNYPFDRPMPSPDDINNMPVPPDSSFTPGSKIIKSSTTGKSISYNPATSNIEGIEESLGGWKPGMRTKFDTALMNGNAKVVKELLPQVPLDYKTRFSDQIDEVINGGISVYHGEGSHAHPSTGSIFGDGYYVSRTQEEASQFGDKLVKGVLPLKKEDILTIHNQNELDDLYKAVMMKYPKLDIESGLPKYVKDLGYKAVEGKTFMDGINIFDKSLLKKVIGILHK